MHLINLIWVLAPRLRRLFWITRQKKVNDNQITVMNAKLCLTCINKRNNVIIICRKYLVHQIYIICVIIFIDMKNIFLSLLVYLLLVHIIIQTIIIYKHTEFLQSEVK